MGGIALRAERERLRGGGVGVKPRLALRLSVVVLILLFFRLGVIPGYARKSVSQLMQ
jgi:hypothetical protein